MKIELLINEETKIYTVSHPSAYHYRKLMEFDQEIDYSDMNLEDLDKVSGFVCDVFDGQFDIDEFYKGIKSYRLMDTCIDVFSFVRTGIDPEKRKEKIEVIHEQEDDEGNEQGK